MCFSATASFSASAVCAVVGVLALGRARRSDRLLAATPLVFAAHQAIEGYVWLTHAAGCGLYAAYTFTIVAFCLWPLYVPAATWFSETDPGRRKIILAFGGLGVFMGADAAWTLTSGITIDFASNQISYFPKGLYYRIFDYVYLACVVGPFFVHRNVYIKAFGGIVVAFFAIAVVFFNPARFSVWCFFAAFSSLIIYLFVVSRDAAPSERDYDRSTVGPAKIPADA